MVVGEVDGWGGERESMLAGCGRRDLLQAGFEAARGTRRRLLRRRCGAPSVPCRCLPRDHAAPRLCPPRETGLNMCSFDAHGERSSGALPRVAARTREAEHCTERKGKESEKGKGKEIRKGRVRKLVKGRKSLGGS